MKLKKKYSCATKSLSKMLFKIKTPGWVQGYLSPFLVSPSLSTYAMPFLQFQGGGKGF